MTPYIASLILSILWGAYVGAKGDRLFETIASCLIGSLIICLVIGTL